MMPSTASPAAAATGLPPKVVPCAPGPSRDAAAPVATQAPTGKPLPRPLANVTMSPVTPDLVLASQSPQRPMPVLHLVDPQQCTGGAGQLTYLDQIVRRRFHTPFSP